MNKALIFFAGLLFLFVGGMAILFASRGGETADNNHVTIEEPNDTVIEDTGEPVEFSFLDQNGKRFESKSLDGKLWIGSIFFSTCPSTCRAQNMKVSELQTLYAGKDVEFVSITCDPEVDTPPTLNGYAAKFSANADHWHFLTGDLDLIKRVGGARFGIAVDDKVHSDRLVLFNRDGTRVDSFRSLEVEQFEALKQAIDGLLSQEPAENEEAESDAAYPAEPQTAVVGEGE